MKYLIRFSISLIAVSFLAAKDISVTWLKAPPEKIGPDHVIDVAWKVEGIDSDYRALVTICPLSLGPNCKKGPDRQDGHMFTSNDKGEYQDQLQISAKPDGQYYIVAYGALSKKKFYNTKPIVVEYNSTFKQEKDTSEIPVTEANTESENNNSSSGTVIITPGRPAPYPYPYPYPYSYPENYYEEGYENHEQRQDGRQDNHQERQDGRQDNHQERQDGRQGNHQERQDGRGLNRESRDGRSFRGRH